MKITGNYLQVTKLNDRPYQWYVKLFIDDFTFTDYYNHLFLEEGDETMNKLDNQNLYLK